MSYEMKNYLKVLVTVLVVFALANTPPVINYLTDSVMFLRFWLLCKLLAPILVVIGSVLLITAMTLDLYMKAKFIRHEEFKKLGTKLGRLKNQRTVQKVIK